MTFEFVCQFQGIYITYVYEGGPAHRAGLQVHDKILQVHVNNVVFDIQGTFFIGKIFLTISIFF